ncbi:MAG: YHS domain-containing protein [Deltaproteobacteria bacterium]|nr:YHS domain-containing protein [Deltaproteobacteria bacterium]
MAIDPICGIDVDEKTADFQTRLEHETFYFCSKACQERFEIKEGLRREDKKWWQRLLKEPKGGGPPKCH